MGFQRALASAPLPNFAAVLPPVLALEVARLRRRRRDLAPFAILEHDLVAAGENLEGLLHLSAVVELRRARLAEDLEVRRIDEVRHLESIHAERERVILDRIGGLVRVGRLSI